jgi:glutaminase
MMQVRTLPTSAILRSLGQIYVKKAKVKLLKFKSICESVPMKTGKDSMNITQLKKVKSQPTKPLISSGALKNKI